jgi:hypothetical protein
MHPLLHKKSNSAKDRLFPKRERHGKFFARTSVKKKNIDGRKSLLNKQMLLLGKYNACEGEKFFVALSKNLYLFNFLL